MNRSVSGYVVSLLALGTAVAQTVSPQQRATVPVQRAPAVSGPAVTTPATRVSPVLQNQTVAAKATLPSNILNTQDSQIINVGGKPVAAGVIKQQLQNELRQASTPASARFVRPSPQSMPVRDLTGHIGTRPLDRVGATTLPPRTGGPFNGRQITAEKQPYSYSDMLTYCKTHPAEITRVQGAVTPNGRFKIQGICFGDTVGRVEAIGQFPGGNMRLVFENWNATEISAFVPPVSGATDHTIALTVVRADNARSPAVQAQFIATRQQVPVPAGFWSQNPNFVAIQVDQGGGDIFSGFTVFAPGSPQRATPFSLRINPACALDTAAWSSRTGRVDAFNGWDTPGPPNTANVNVVWTPRCVTQTSDYVFSSDIQRVCSVEYTISATAQCPVGIAP